MEIVDRLFLTAPLPNGDGYSWTLASLLGKMISLAEERFGPRDLAYTVLGFEFVDAIPQCWYPRTCKHIVIQIGKTCLTEPDRACFQLAHETIHLLSPTGERNANVLEEGLAAHFQTWYMANHYPADWPRTGVDWGRFQRESYAQAKRLVEQLIGLAPDVIKRLRVKQPTLSQITADAISNACPGLEPDVATALACRFKRDEIAENNAMHTDGHSATFHSHR